MQSSEQAHAVSVYRQLVAQGETSSDLLAAALLHDVGKSLSPLRLWERVLIVLARVFFRPNPGAGETSLRAVGTQGMEAGFRCCRAAPGLGSHTGSRGGCLSWQ